MTEDSEECDKMFNDVDDGEWAFEAIVKKNRIKLSQISKK